MADEGQASDCASCRTADSVAALVLRSYGLSDDADPPACDHEIPSTREELAGLYAAMWADFSSVRERPTQSGPVPSIAADPDHELDCIVLEWAAAIGVDHHDYMRRRREFVEGHLGIGATLLPRTVMTRALKRLYELGLLGRGAHRTTLVHGGLVGAHAVPVRLPGRSIVVVPGDAGPLCTQYLMHELGHVLEHSARGRLPLHQRFDFRAARSEGFALVTEALAREPDWWASLGLGPLMPPTLIQHLRFEHRYSLKLAQLVAQDDPPAASWSLSIDDIERFRSNIDYWRALLNGSVWADAQLQDLGERFGPRWWRQQEAWFHILELASCPPRKLEGP